MFTRFWVLGFLIVPCLLLAWVWLRERGRIVLPFDHGRQRQGWRAKAAIHLFESFPALLLAVVIILLAGPQRLDEPKTKRMLTNIEFCVDVSASMGWALGEGTRYDHSLVAINEFLDYRKGDAFGLTFFGHNVLHWVPLTSDISAIRCAPPFMEPTKAPPWMQGTKIVKALQSCRDVLTKRQEGDRMIILVSDGQGSDFADDNDIQLAKQLKQDNIVVYSVHISNEQVPGPIANITTMTGGEVFEVGDPAALKSVFQRIDQMQQTKLEKTMAESMDYFEPFCIAGLSLLGLIGIGWFGLRYTPW